MVDKIKITGATDISAKRANGFRQCSDLDIDAAMDFKMVDGVAAIAAQHARGVGIVHHHDCAVLFGKVAEAGQRADIAIHGKHAIADQQFLPGFVFDARQSLFGLGEILVLEDQKLGA